MKAAFFLALCLAAAPSGAYDKSGRVVMLSEEEDARCAIGDGCVLVPKSIVRDELDKIFERGHEAGRISCGNRT